MKKIATILASYFLAFLPFLGILALVVCVLSCAKDPVATQNTSNNGIQVDFLFEKDGIKVYRFVDAGERIYYTSAPGRTMYRSGDDDSRKSVEVETAEREVKVCPTCKQEIKK